ncbi:MAG: protein kinase domain-containing protein, partial [Bryobacteraceae bacterium]
SAPGTEEGQVLGTIAYMAPEQVEGKKIDARTDVFAFGVVLYEMLTGRRAFERDSRIGTLSAILKDTPQAVSELSTETPQELERIILRCLRKEPDRRYQSMRDVKNALEEVKEESESGRLSQRSMPKVEPKKTLPLRWIALAAAVVALAAGLAWWWKHRLQPAPLELAVRALTADTGLTTAPAISPDGKLIAYASDRATQKNLDIWVHPLSAGGQPIRITRHEADDFDPAFSPDGGLIAFRSNRDGGGIYITPTLGGDERLLVRGGRGPQFSPDGKWVAFFVSASGFTADSTTYLVPVTGGEPKPLAPEVPWTASPVFSPEGRNVMLVGAPNTNRFTEAEIWIKPMDGSAAVKTGMAATLRRQSPALFAVSRTESRLLATFPLVSGWLDARLLISAGGRVWELPIEKGTWKPIGPPRQLTGGASDERSAHGVALGNATRIAFVAGTMMEHLWSLKLDANKGVARGPMEPLPHSGGAQIAPSGPADGSRLVFQQSDPGGRSLRLRDMATGRETSILSQGARPKISPDGKHLAYSTNEGLFLMPARGGDATRVVPFERPTTGIFGWTADSRRIVYSTAGFFTFDLEKQQSSEIFSQTKYPTHTVEFSPDQRWVAFVTPIGRRAPLWVAPVREGHAAEEEEWIQIIDRDVEHRRPWWSPDGNLLYFITYLDGFLCIYAQRLDPATKRPVGEPFAVYHFHTTRLRLRPGLAYFGPAVFRDRIVFGVPEETGNIWIGDSK